MNHCIFAALYRKYIHASSWIFHINSCDTKVLCLKLVPNTSGLATADYSAKHRKDADEVKQEIAKPWSAQNEMEAGQNNCNEHDWKGIGMSALRMEIAEYRIPMLHFFPLGKCNQKKTRTRPCTRASRQCGTVR